MPRLQPSDKELMDRQVERSLKNWQNKHRLNEAQAAEKLGVSVETLRNWKNNPDSFLKKIRLIAWMCKPDDNELLRMIRPER